MKKRRILKGWLRVAKYSFKSRFWKSRRNVQVLPDELFRLSRSRLRKLEWRDSDEKYYRRGLRHAFSFHPKARRNAPWLEVLLYRRALYPYKRAEFRRYMFPREQKSHRWREKLRKLMYRRKLTNTYFKKRRWHLTRMYNQRLSRSLFDIRTSKAALKRTRKRARLRTKTTGLEQNMVGFGDRLDVTLILMGIAPTTFWARVLAKMGLLRINGKVVRDPTFRFKKGDYVEWVWDKIQRLKSHFKPLMKKRSPGWLLHNSSFRLPGNFEYNAKLRSAYYTRLPRPGDLPCSARLNEYMFLHFRLDSGLGK